MNILEMEDMVKGLPDQVVAQYAQFPDAQVPQFLALSELQRRQDMRQRFQAQQQGMEPTVKDQILQGGIASAMPSDGMAPPMDQGMAPPMAPPQAMPQQAPAMMAEGGVVGGAKEFGKAYVDRVREQASTPKGLLSFVPGVGGLMAAADQLRSLRQYFPSTPEATGFAKYFPETNKAGLSLGRVDTVRADPNLVDPESDALDREYQALISSQQNAMYAPFHSTMTGFDPTAGGTYDPGSQIMSSIGGPSIPGEMSDGGMVPGGIVQMYDGRVVPNESVAARRSRLTAERNAALQAGDIETANEIERQLRIGTPAGTLSRGAAAQQAAINQPMFERMGIVPAMETPEVSMDEPSFDLTLPVVPTPTAAQSDVNAQVAPPPAEDGGIGAFNRTPPASRAYPSIPEVVGLIQGLSADQGRPQEVTDYINLIRQQTEQGLPPPVDLGQFVTRAEERERSIREDARRQALGAALLQLGAGVASGEMASGLRGAGEQAAQIMGQGRREAAQQQALAEQLRMRGAESSREAQVQAMNLSRDATKAIADIATSERQTQAQRELSATTLLTNFVSAMEKVAGDLDQQEQLNARSFATTATNLFESMVGPLTGFETPEQLAKRDEALVKSVTLAANMTGQDPEPVLKSLREGAPVTIQYKGKSYRFPNQKAADEFKRRRQAGE